MNEDDFKESKELIELLKENVQNWMKKQKADTGNNSEKGEKWWNNYDYVDIL